MQDYTTQIGFWKRLLSFVKDVEVSDAMGEEEKQMLVYIAEQKIEEMQK